MADFTLIVTDTSPLITLAKADQLDLFLLLGVVVRIPDIVYLEATRDGHDDGAKIATWARRNDELVRITPTSRVVEWQVLKENGFKARDYGEIAAIEVATDYARERPETAVLLLYEDADMNHFAIRAEVDLATTGTFLAALEEAGLIQSADQVLDQAASAGRNVERQRNQPSNPDISAALRRAQTGSGDLDH